MRSLERLIQLEKPGMVIMTDYGVDSRGTIDGWKQLVKPLVRYQVPFTVIFRESRKESETRRSEISEYLQGIPYYIDDPSTVPVLSATDSTAKWQLYFFDGYAYPTAMKSDATNDVKRAHIDWYRRKREGQRGDGRYECPAVAFLYPHVDEDTGTRDTSYSELIEAFLEEGDVVGAFVDYDDGAIRTYEDRICIVPTGKENEVQGARIIGIYEDERRLGTQVRTLSGALDSYAFEPSLAKCDYPIANGTFIQNALVRDWDDARWQQEFETLAAAGMRYLVFAPLLHEDKEGKTTAPYPSDIPGVSQRNEHDVVDACLRNAELAGFKVFLGLNFNEHWWASNMDPEWLYGQMAIGNRVASELYEKYGRKYPGACYGWYWVWEVANVEVFAHADGQRMLANALNVNLDYLNERYPEMPFMLAPYMNYRIGNASDYAKMWKNVFSMTHFKSGDIFGPQDCVGAGGLGMEHVQEWFAALGEAVKSKPGLRFWSDAETFEQEFWTSATLDRFVRQMKLVTPYVSGIISFAYSHYYSPLRGDDSFHQAYMHYVSTGRLPITEELPPVADVRITQLEGVIQLTWAPPKERDLISGYHIYRNGVRIGNIQFRKHGDAQAQFSDDVGDGRALYEIATYNTVGRESIRVPCR